ncbi:hypothetical protein BWI17_18425 [Betaproteobacteria bacterium GR16-43]|nr:hypothetical protein BWI17_18425 [Betaproteobacteria bacterium GR16-43]
MAHPAKHLSWWKPALAKPFSERIGPAPAKLVEFIALDNIGNGFPNKPRISKAPADFVRDVKAAFEELPEAVKRPLTNRLAGIYFVEDLGGTGFTDMIVDDAGKPAGGFIVLDPTVLLQHTANTWATWRDGTPFKPSADDRLEVTIETPANDNRKQAIQYILLHEIGHVLSIGSNFHPNWNTPLDQVGATAQYPFYELSWRLGGSPLAYRTLFDAAFPQRKDVVYYFGPRIPADQMVETYTGLGKTNFATLYSSSHPGDDFAEAFANYVHVVMMKRPFEIRLYHFGQLALTYPACWSEPRCAPKRVVLEALLK